MCTYTCRLDGQLVTQTTHWWDQSVRTLTARTFPTTGRVPGARGILGMSFCCRLCRILDRTRRHAATPSSSPRIVENTTAQQQYKLQGAHKVDFRSVLLPCGEAYIWASKDIRPARCARSAAIVSSCETTVSSLPKLKVREVKDSLYKTCL